MNEYSIQFLPEDDRPRERMARLGPEALSTLELIALILGSGTKDMPVLQLAQQILRKFGSLQRLCEATVQEFCQIKGVGLAKAIQIKAALSLGVRAARQSTAVKYRIEHPVHAYNLVKEELEKETRELFIVIMHDIKSCVITHEVISIGTLSNTLVHPREVFYPAIRHKAASLILAHNHPSGDPTPSKQDYDLTKRLVETSKVVGIPIYDHIILGANCYISLRQKGFSFSPSED